MQCRKKEEIEKSGKQHYLACQVCGKIVNARECSWDEDDGLMCCRDCREERESCGCSD
jgi:hypothetical protein